MIVRPVSSVSVVSSGGGGGVVRDSCLSDECAAVSDRVREWERAREAAAFDKQEVILNGNVYETNDFYTTTLPSVFQQPQRHPSQAAHSDSLASHLVSPLRSTNRRSKSFGTTVGMRAPPSHSPPPSQMEDDAEEETYFGVRRKRDKSTPTASIFDSIFGGASSSSATGGGSGDATPLSSLHSPLVGRAISTSGSRPLRLVSQQSSKVSHLTQSVGGRPSVDLTHELHAALSHETGAVQVAEQVDDRVSGVKKASLMVSRRYTRARGVQGAKERMKRVSM